MVCSTCSYLVANLSSTTTFEREILASWFEERRRTEITRFDIDDETSATDYFSFDQWSFPSITFDLSSSTFFQSVSTFLSCRIHCLCVPLDFRSPFEFAGGPFGRVVPSSSTAFGGLGSLFPSPSLIDRKGDPNGSTAANLGLDWSRFHRSLVPDNGTVKKLEEMTANHNDK